MYNRVLFILNNFFICILYLYNCKKLKRIIINNIKYIPFISAIKLLNISITLIKNKRY
jgi:hypothetical protein